MTEIKRVIAARELYADYKLTIAQAEAEVTWVDKQLDFYREKRQGVRTAIDHSALTVHINTNLKEKIYLQRMIETYRDLAAGLQFRFGDDI